MKLKELLLTREEVIINANPECIRLCPAGVIIPIHHQILSNYFNRNTEQLANNALNQTLISLEGMVDYELGRIHNVMRADSSLIDVLKTIYSERIREKNYYTSITTPSSHAEPGICTLNINIRGSVYFNIKSPFSKSNFNLTSEKFKEFFPDAFSINTLRSHNIIDLFDAVIAKYWCINYHNELLKKIIHD